MSRFKTVLMVFSFFIVS